MVEVSADRVKSIATRLPERLRQHNLTLAGWYERLHSILPDLRVVGGCCGTDHEHVTAIAEALVGVRS